MDNMKVNEMTGMTVADLSTSSQLPRIDGTVDYYGKSLTSLIGTPEYVSGDFSIDHNPITSMTGGPKEVGGHYYCRKTNISSLTGAPLKIGGCLSLNNNPHLHSLEGINQIKTMNNWIMLHNTPITSHILGVFFIKGCKGISAIHDCPLGKAVEILNRHIGKGRAGLLACTNELIGAGLADFAQI
jgi:hypothetical protein